MLRLAWKICALALTAGLAGCAASGPYSYSISSSDIAANAQIQEDGTYRGDYFLFQVDQDVLRIAADHRPAYFATAFGIGSSRDRQRIDVGDTLGIQIWEASEGGLFSTSRSKSVQLDSEVDHEGKIFIPYVGRIHVAGQTVESIRQNIQSDLQGRAIEPQVQVAAINPRSHSVVIVGVAAASGRIPIAPGGTRVLDLIAQVGGSLAPTYETTVRLSRGTRTVSAQLEHVFNEADNNIFLKPDDRLLLSHEPRSFTAFGAVKAESAHPFGAPELTLAEALGKAGGLVDERSDAGGIFLFRFEDAAVVQQLRPDVDLTGYTRVPVVYQFSFRDPEGFFEASKLKMRDKDIIYVANSLSTEFAKFLEVLQPVFNAALTATAISVSLDSD